MPPLPPLRLTELHFVALEGGSLVVPAPRAGLDRAPPGTVPALLPLFFPGLRAVAPPVQVGVYSKHEQEYGMWRTFLLSWFVSSLRGKDDPGLLEHAAWPECGIWRDGEMERVC